MNQNNESWLLSHIVIFILFNFGFAADVEMHLDHGKVIGKRVDLDF